MKEYFKLAWRVAKKLVEDEATHLAAGVAYYTTLSLLPLMMGVLAISGLIWDSESIERNLVGLVTANLPGSQQLLADNAAQIVQHRGALSLGALLGLLWAGSAAFSSIARAMNRIWGVSQIPPFYVSKPVHVLMAAAAGVLFLLSAVATTVIEIVAGRFQRLDIPSIDSILGTEISDLPLRVVPASIMLLVFLLIYRYSPNIRTDWKYLWPGAIIAAVLFEASKSLFVWYLDNLAVYTQIYSLLTSIMSLLIWIYVSALILILGAEISSEYRKMPRV